MSDITHSRKSLEDITYIFWRHELKVSPKQPIVQQLWDWHEAECRRRLQELGEEIRYKSPHGPHALVNIDLVNEKILRAIERAAI